MLDGRAHRRPARRIFDAELGRARQGRRAATRRLVRADPGPAQCAQCAGRHRGRDRSRHRRRRDPSGAGRLLRRQAPLPADRQWNGVAIYDDYGHHPAEIAAVLAAARARRQGPRHRRRRAASLHARARSLRRVLRAASAMPTASSSRRSIRPAKRRSRASITARSPKASAPPATRPCESVDERARSRAGDQRVMRGPATWSSASAPATRPNGRMRCPSGSPRRRCAREARRERSRTSPAELAGS